MLVLGVRQGEAVIIETLQGPVRIELQPNARRTPGRAQQRLVFTADRRIKIWREKIYKLRQEESL